MFCFFGRNSKYFILFFFVKAIFFGEETQTSKRHLIHIYNLYIQYTQRVYNIFVVNILSKRMGMGVFKTNVYAFDTAMQPEKIWGGYLLIGWRLYWNKETHIN